MNMKKKTKIIAISILGFLLLVPFMRPSRAQVPSYVGVALGEHYEFDLNIYVGPSNEIWSQWFTDNMTAHWAAVFKQTFLDNMETVYNLTEKVPLQPQATLFYTVDSIIPDTGGFDVNSDGGITADETWASPGETLVNMSGGTFADFGGWPYYYYFPNGTGIFIGNTTAKFAEDIGYGAMATSAVWATNMYNIANTPYYGYEFDKNYTNTLFFAPNNVNWTKFADECNTNLELDYGIWGTWGYILTITELTDGFTMFSDVGQFGNNSETITITTTYDSNGLMTYHSFEYGSDLLLDMGLVDSTYPVITDAPSDFTVDHDYTGVTLSWTATDANPGEYAILQNGTAVVFPTAWSSGVAIQFAVPDGLASGDYAFQINFGDTRPNRPNVVSDVVIMTVLPAPPGDIALSSDAGTPDIDGNFNLIWTVSLGADNYSLYRYGSPITEINGSLALIADQTATSPFLILGLIDGEYYFVVVAHNQYGDTISNNIHITVQIADNPPGLFTASTNADFPDADGIFNLSWTISNGADSYSLYMHDSPITVIDSSLTLLLDHEATSTFPVSGLPNGEYYFVVVAHNQYGDTMSNNVHVTVIIPGEPGEPSPPGISGYNTFVILGIVIFTVGILFKKKKIKMGER